MAGPWERYGGTAPPAVIRGQPRQPPPQTPAQATVDQYQAAAAPDQARIAAANAERAEIEAANAARQAADPAGAAAVEQRKAAGFFNRALRSNQLYEQQGVGARDPLSQTAVDWLPANATNPNTSPERQQAEAAMRDFIAATLRYESGANLPQPELETQARIFFPAPGDAPETIRLKAELRRNAIEALRAGGGQAADAQARAYFMESAAALPAALPQPDPERGQRPEGTPMWWDEARPPDHGNPLTVEQQRAWDAFNAANPRATREQIVGFFQSIGKMPINIDDLARTTESGRPAAPGSSAHYATPDISDARGGQPSLQLNGTLGLGPVNVSGSLNSEQVDAFGRGAADIATVGGADYLSALGDTLTSGGTFAENLWRQREIDNYDEQRHPISRFAGQAAGGLALPTSVASVGRAAAVQALRGGATREAAIQAARRAVAGRMAAEGGTFSGLYGFNSSEGDVAQGAAEGIVSALLGGGFSYGLGAAGSRMLGPRIDRAPRGDPNQLAAAQAANELDIGLPRFVAGGAGAQQAGAAAEQTTIGGPIIRGAKNALLDDASEAAGRIARDVGRPLEDTAMGEAASDAMSASRLASSREGNRLYTVARNAAGDAPISPQQTIQAVGAIIREDSQGLLPTEIRPILDRLRQRLESGEPITIDGARLTRTELNNQFRQTTTPGNAARLTRQIMDALNNDIETSLRAAGRGNAVADYRRADQFWANRLDTINRVLDRYTGKDGQNFGEAVARAIISDSQGGGTRLARMLAQLDNDSANSIRATLIDRLGRATDGQQNAAGNEFSLETFLTNWNRMRGARERVFDPATVRSLNNLALVAQRARDAGRERNFSGTGRAILRALMGAIIPSAGAASGATMNPLPLAVGVGAHGLIALRQYVNARSLASPTFARRLAATPADDARARAYWAQPWVAKLARSEPAIANDLLGIQRTIVRALGQDAAPLAAETGQQQENQPQR